MIHKIKAFVPLALVVLISACTAKGDNPGVRICSSDVSLCTLRATDSNRGRR